jgi:tetratricopeptide (TPR) repeat protein
MVVTRSSVARFHRRPIRVVGIIALALMPAACGLCVENIIPDQAVENTAFCAQYIAEDKLTEAEARCKIAIEYSSTYAEPHNLMGLIHYKRGHIERAVESFKHAIALRNDFAEAYNNLGGIFMERREYLPAEDQFREALSIDPGHVDARANLAKTLYYQHRDDDAREQYLRCIELDPNYCECRMGLGVLTLAKREFDEARTHFKKHTEICPDDAQGFYSYGFTNFEMGRCQDATDAFVAALSLNPAHLESRKAIVEAYDCLGKQDGALKVWIDKIRQNPGDPEPHYQLGTLYEDRQDYSRALTEYLNTIKLRADYIGAYYRAARIYNQQVQTQDTITYCQKFVDLQRDNTMAKERDWCISRVKELQYGNSPVVLPFTP